ncbi:MAG: YggT family protein [Candidatus Saccharibacteria bacterium]|nr:YggT family protein [Candidatus Saccharibacteria bacterium]
MAEDIQYKTETSTRTGDTVQRTTETSNPMDLAKHQQNVAVRIVWFITGALMTLLAFRFLLSLLGANPTNGLADFVYNTSQPLVSPFFNLFNYNSYTYGESRFETYTLVAVLFYGVVAWGITKLIMLNRD